VAALYALLGGTAAGVLLFGAGLSFWALVVALRLTVGLAITTVIRSGSPQAIPILLAYSSHSRCSPGPRCCSRLA
jgi:hypothetical protein